MAKIPAKLGPYECLEILGEGSMGIVYLCYDPALDRRLVVKKMNDELSGSLDSIQRFTREARLVADADHPNITHIYGFWKEKGSLHMAMEFVDGLNLRQILDRIHKIPASIVTVLFSELLQGLRSLHRLGIVHRDIKPANIMVSFSGQVKLLDFGVARAQGDTQLTATGAIIGTTAYMSPEQCQGMDVSAASDFFSLAITLFEALYGKHPFRSSDPAETIKNILHAQTVKLPVPKSASKLLNILRFCLKKKGIQRPQQASEILKRLWPLILLADTRPMLEEFMTQVKLGRPYVFPTPWAAFLLRIVKRLMWVLFGVIMGVFISFMYLIWLGQRQGQDWFDWIHQWIPTFWA